MNIVFVPWIAHAGLALSIGLAASINAAFLFHLLKKRGLYTPEPGWGLFLIRLGGALFLLAGVGMWIAAQFDWIALKTEPFLRIGALLIVILACAISYFGALLLMGFRFRDFKRLSD
jgi:putative peptidoglycan lipid II flippase